MLFCWLMYKLRTQTQNKNSELMSTPTCTLQTTHTDLKQNRQANNRQIKNNSKTTTNQLLQLSRFDDQSHHEKTDQSKPRPARHKYQHLMTALHLTLKMTTVPLR